MDRPARSAARAPRREWTEAEARAWVTQWKTSGLSVPAFAAQHGFNADRFYRWRRKFETTPATAPTPAVLPLVAVRATPPAAPALPASFELVCGRGRVLRIPAAFEPAALRALLRVLDDEAPAC
jgi:transposase-like protein